MQNNNELDIGFQIESNKITGFNAQNIRLEAMTGNVLGDGTLGKYSQKEPQKLFFEIPNKERQYINHLYRIYNIWTTAKIYNKNQPKSGKIRINTKGEISPPTWAFITKVQTDLMFFKDFCEFTDNNKYKKVIPKNIANLLTARSLAYWFMDDGAIKQKTRRPLLICTDRYTYHEVIFLCSVLKEKFDIDCKEQKNTAGRSRIYITSKGAKTFKDIVLPYMLPCFMYKLEFIQ